MDDCDEILRELETYLDQELSPEAWRSIQAHLNGCLDCLHVFDFHAELRMVIARKCQEDALPPGLLSRIEDCFGTVDVEESDVSGPSASGPGPA
jgi:mycothiol system anti-sigma-R factor